MAENEEDNIEILDAEHFRGDKAQKFSHSAIVMACMRKALELGSKEMKGGYFNIKIDNRGNETRTYVSDTRQDFIESVNITETLMSRDLDDEYNKAKEKIQQEADEEYDKLVKAEEIFWKELNFLQKKELIKEGIIYYKGCINEKLLFGEKWKDLKVKVAHKILAELGKVVSRCKDYEMESYEG